MDALLKDVEPMRILVVAIRDVEAEKVVVVASSLVINAQQVEAVVALADIVGPVELAAMEQVATILVVMLVLALKLVLAAVAAVVADQEKHHALIWEEEAVVVA